MKLEWVNMLRDPVTSDNLIKEENYLINKCNGNKYMIEDGIIKFIEENKLEGNNKKYLELYDKVARFYNVANKVYFLFKFGGERNYRKQFLSELEIKENDKVIEISVGTADNFLFLPGNIDRYGLDISFGMLNQANKHIKKWRMQAQFFQGTAENLPFKDETFDVVYHVGGINYFNDPEKAIREMIRIAKSGTKLVIVDETAELVKGTYRKNPVTRKYYNDKQPIFSPLEWVPEEMLNVKYKEVCKGLMYCLTFRKP